MNAAPNRKCVKYSRCIHRESKREKTWPLAPRCCRALHIGRKRVIELL